MTKKQSVGIGAGIGLAIVAILWLAASPYLTLRRIQQAVAMQDARTVSGYIDFDALRASIKNQTRRELAQNAKRRGTSPDGLAAATIATDRMVDMFVQPPLITLMLSDTRSPKNPVGGKILGPEVKVRRTGLTTFEVTGSHPGAVLFEMRGLGWKMVGIEARPATQGEPK